MSNLSTEYRIQCLELAIKVTGPREPLEERFGAFSRFVGRDDPTRLACLRLAVTSHGPIPRLWAKGIVAAAEEYLEIVSPSEPKAEAPKKRGRKS